MVVLAVLACLRETRPGLAHEAKGQPDFPGRSTALTETAKRFCGLSAVAFWRKRDENSRCRGGGSVRRGFEVSRGAAREAPRAARRPPESQRRTARPQLATPARASRAVLLPPPSARGRRRQAGEARRRTARAGRSTGKLNRLSMPSGRETAEHTVQKGEMECV
jgi:hypothetical protein